MIVGINYADKKYRKAQRLNTRSMYNRGKVDKVIEYSPEMIDLRYRAEHVDILSCSRGNGYWLWKPYFVLHTLDLLQEGDYLFYCDSGAVVLNAISLFIENMEREGQSIMPFSLTFKEKQYSKRDAFVFMECDEPQYTDTPQRLSGYFLVKKNKYSMKVIADYLHFCEAARIITDNNNVTGENYPEFIENRHDQTVWSLVTKKYNIPAFVDPSQWGIKKQLFDIETVNRSQYPVMIDSHRRANISTWIRYKYYRRRHPWEL